MHAWSTSMLLLLHSAFMLSVVKMLLKVVVGDREVLFDYWIFHNRSSKIIGQEVSTDDRL